MDWKSLLFSFDGRVGRKGFWLGTLAIVVVGVLVNGALFALMMGTATSAEPGAAAAPSLLPSLVALAIGLVLFWAALAVQAKRWHDQDKSAWWILVNLVPAVGGLIALVMCGFVKGTEGSNRYGGTVRA